MLLFVLSKMAAKKKQNPSNLALQTFKSKYR